MVLWKRYLCTLGQRGWSKYEELSINGGLGIYVKWYIIFCLKQILSIRSTYCNSSSVLISILYIIGLVPSCSLSKQLYFSLSYVKMCFPLLSYSQLSRKPLLFKSFTGLSVQQFDDIFKIVESKYKP
jgi:hypothetical protein